MERLPIKQEEDLPNVTPDSSMTVNSKSDLDNSLMMFQVKCLCLYHIKTMYKALVLFFSISMLI